MPASADDQPPFLAPPAHDGAVHLQAPPTMSVVVAAHNAANTIGQSLASALDQTRRPAQIVVCDDGSSDDLESGIAPFRDAVDLIRQPNRGEAAAKNTGAERATGTYVVFLDADDVFAPRRLECMAELLAARPDLDIVTTDAHLVVEGRRVGRCYGQSWSFETADQQREILRRNFIFGLAAVRRERLLEVGGFDTAFTHATDWDLWLRLIRSGSRAGLVTEPLADYRLSSGSLSANRSLLLAGRAAVLRKALASQALSPEERAEVSASVRREEAHARLAAAHEALRAGTRDARARALRAAVSPGVAAPARLRAALAAVAPRLARSRLLRDGATAGIPGPAGVRFAADGEATSPSEPGRSRP